MIISAKTDIGKVRKSNQDYYGAGEIDNGITWAVVCDGMGGALGGNVASENAVKIISKKITSGYYKGMNDNSIKHLLISAVESANAALFSMSNSDSSLSGMGTTVVLVIVTVDTVFLASVGDSRIYVISDDSINQITTDHSVVQMMIESGEITPEEARSHPEKNVITRALGVDSSVRIDYAQETINENDIILLCSDGLTNYVDNEKIKSVCLENDKYKLADILVDIANENGGGDNVTVVSVSQ